MINEQSGHSDGATPGGPTDKVGSPAAATPTASPPVATSSLAQRQTPAGSAVDQELIRRIEELPREAGWVLVTAGVIGLIMPGIIGVPFLVAGAFVLTPAGPRTLSRWAGRKPRKFAHSALRQICRLIDDLERRYPHRPVVRADTPLVTVEHRRHVDVQ
jgi:hypothetical protein